jgi:hypothetical protein
MLFDVLVMKRMILICFFPVFKHYDASIHLLCIKNLF